jgi:hypothetical protein
VINFGHKFSSNYSDLIKCKIIQKKKLRFSPFFYWNFSVVLIIVTLSSKAKDKNKIHSRMKGIIYLQNKEDRNKINSYVINSFVRYNFVIQ